MSTRPRFTALLFLALLVAACGGEDGETGITTSPPSTSTATEPATIPAPTDTAPTTSAPGTTMSDENSPVDAVLEPLVTIARQDLAARLGVEESTIQIATVEWVVWPDGSLGCPQPGMVYTQVQVDGYRILLVTGETEYAYHGGGNRGPFLCEVGG